MDMRCGTNSYKITQFKIRSTATAFCHATNTVFRVSPRFMRSCTLKDFHQTTRCWILLIFFCGNAWLLNSSTDVWIFDGEYCYPRLDNSHYIFLAFSIIQDTIIVSSKYVRSNFDCQLSVIFIKWSIMCQA
jgi:hypothetical protein